MTQTEAHAYFERYVAAFITDATSATNQFLNVPCTIVERDKSVALTSRDALMQNFARLNDANDQMGIHRAEVVSCAVTPTMADNVIETKVDWRFENADGEEIYAFETRYVLCNYGHGWKITVVVNVDG